MVRSEAVDEGAFANVGQALARIYASDAAEVVVPVTDGDAALIPGLWDLQGDGSVPATVLAEFGGRTYAWDGYVDRVETALDEQSRTIDLVVRVERPFRPGTPVDGAADPLEGAADLSQGGAPPLLVGQFVDVRIQGRTGPYHVLPRRGVRTGDEAWGVRDSIVRIVPVRILQQLQDSVFVAGDFRDGESVIVAGISLATDGMRVRREAGEG